MLTGVLSWPVVLEQSVLRMLLVFFSHFIQSRVFYPQFTLRQLIQPDLESWFIARPRLGPSIQSGLQVVAQLTQLWQDCYPQLVSNPGSKRWTLAENVESLLDLRVINPDNLSNVSVESVLKFCQSKFPKKLIIGHININSIKNKFKILKSMLSEVLDVLMIIEVKLDDSFPEQQFHMEGFNIPFRLDRNRHGGRLLIYVCNNINAVFLKSYVFPDNIDAFFIEILRKSYKWLICCSYNPNRINVATHLDETGKALDTYSKKHENTQ